jgi:DNA-binding transcriptional ArsR family regulator
MKYERNSPDHGSEKLASRLGALSHPARLKILRQLAANECCCKDVVEGLHLAQSTVSQHLKVLVEAGLVTMKQDRRRSIYEIDRAALAEVAKRFSTLVSSCCGNGETVLGCSQGAKTQE